MTEWVLVPKLPDCDICGKEAGYDAKTQYGPWAYLCERHWLLFGIRLGTGFGQKLVLEPLEVEQGRKQK